MLKTVSIRHVVLIKALDLDFDAGLSVFTGETGAGKSILLDSLSLALGGRSDVALIQKGADSLSVTAGFEITPAHPIHQLLTEYDIVAEEEVLLRRVILSDGRSKAYVNDQPVSVAFLKRLGEQLVEIHGQFASAGLLNPVTHQDILDTYGRLGDLKKECQIAFAAWKTAQESFHRAQASLEQARADEAFLKEAVAELEHFHTYAGEEAELQNRRHLLMNSEKIITLIGEVFQVLDASDDSLNQKLSQCCHRLEQVNQLAAGGFDSVVQKMAQAQDLLADVTGLLEDKSNDFGHLEELPALDERLFALKSLARKHQTTVDLLPQKLVEMTQALSVLEQGEFQLETLQKTEALTRRVYEQAARQLSQKRTAVAAQLDAAVMAELPALKLDRAVFKTDMRQKEITEGTADGIDTVLFLAATNKGADLMPLHKIASGGELARFMLAIKVNLTTQADAPTLVFDEVDSGVGGATAASVGARLAKLGQVCQVLVVTHSPQVASFGTHHYRVTKQENASGVVTDVAVLSDAERQDEIARMLSGEHLTETAQKMAAELLEKACNSSLIH